KKRMEILQLAMLRPQLAVLDETDSGLDIDALRTVAEGVNRFAGPEMGILIITHYQRILHLVQPDFVHVMYDGRIVQAGGPELVSVRNATEALNLVAYSWGRANVGPGDRILLTEMEHHSNVVPWYQLAVEKGAELDWAPIADDGRLDLEALRSLLEHGPKLVCVAHVSNVLGTINPVAEIAEMAHEAGALVVVDGAQAGPKL